MLRFFGQYIRMTVIFLDFDAISPLKNCIVTHRKWKSPDQHFLWAKMPFSDGQIPTKSVYCPKVLT